MVNWPYNMFMAIHGLKPYPALIGLIGQFSTSPTPIPLSLSLVVDVFSVFQGPMALLATTRFFGPTPYIIGGWPKRPFWAIYAPYGPQAVIHAHGPRPKPQVGPPEAVLAPKLNQPRIGQNHLRTQNGHNSDHGLWKPPEATSSAPRKDSPQGQWKNFPSSMHPVLKDPGVVHIWYNIPLRTIFAQQSNGDIFRTTLRDSKSSPQFITNFEGGCFSYSVLKFPGGYQKTIQEPQPPGPGGVGLSILIRTFLRKFLRVYHSLKSFSRH
ncbi:hypothetical protein O181_084839 [Austropuccinia psidii MF-1]|uniref:Uncharacterized protein n=1 Tax=Austropuccinia psidii MF-1 TaxID=1389203 RepID=A0A9Q3IMR6_9BASI|nr:hypothetical protein [Austropuccinia psidii MF-1]